MKRKHYLAWMLTAALTAASVMPMTVYAQPAFAGGGEVKVVEGDVSGEMQGGVMSPGAVAVEGADLTVNGNVSDGLVSDGATVTVNGNVTGNGIDTVVAEKGTVTVNGTVTATDLSERTGVLASNGSKLTVGDTEVGGKESTGVIAESGSKATAGNVKVSGECMTGASAYGDSTVHVKGNVTADGNYMTGVSVHDGDKSSLIVDGDVTATGANSTGINGETGTIKVGGDVSGGEAVITKGKADVTVGGSVSGTLVGIAAGGNAAVSVKGDVGTKTSAGMFAEENATVTVDGNVTGGRFYGKPEDYEDVCPAIIAGTGATVIVKGTVSTAEGNGSAVAIRCWDIGNQKGTLVIDKAKAGGEASAIYVDADPSASQEYILNSLPDIVVGELVAKNEDFIWNRYDAELYQKDPEDETIGELNEKIYATIRYMIRWNNSEGGSFSVDGTSKYGEYDVAQENQELGITIQIAEGYELESISGGKAQVLQRPDGTWSVIVPRGGGVNLSAVLKRIIKEEMKNSAVSNPGTSGSEEQTTVQKSSGYAEFQKAVRSQIKNAAPGAVVEIDGKNWMSFDRSTMEELSKRNDLTVVVRFRYLGKRWRVVVPAGYAVQTLLNQEGYTGFLYLSAVFGAVPEEA